MPEDDVNNHEANGCLSPAIRLMAGPLCIGLLWVLPPYFVNGMGIKEILFGLFVFLFFIGLFEGSLKSQNRNEDGSIDRSTLVGYAIVFSFLQCVVTIVVGVAVLFLACASGNIGYF